MFEKVKKFYRKHETPIKIIGGVVVVTVVGGIVSKKILKNISPIATTILTDNEIADRKIYESFGAIFKEGFSVPFATEEVAIKFMKERGNTYQVDILDELTSVIWISKPELES